MYTDAYMDNRFEEAVEWKEMAEERLNYLIFQKEIDAHMILNIGAEYNLGKVTLGLNVRNLFNTNYNRSGMNTN
jgi:outer membrane receptor protein involved in Fe transport